MRRRLARPYGQSTSSLRAMSLLMGLAVLAMLYQRAKEPAFWYWMTNESRADDADNRPNAPPTQRATSPDKPAAAEENIVPGPNETDPDELAKLRSNLKAVQDRKELAAHEMPAYWQLMKWSRTRPFADLEKLARRDVPYSHLWEEPDLYRGQPMRLKLHVRRVLSYDAPENPLGLKRVYEAWGWTDDSRSFPFVVVFPEKPAGMPVGTDVDADVVFVGYFVKWMNYRATEKRTNAPLLVGRIKPTTRTAGTAKSGGWETAFLTLLGGVVALGLLGWLGFRKRGRPSVGASAAKDVAPDRLPDKWMSNPSVNAGIESAPQLADFVAVSPIITATAPVVATVPETPVVEPATRPASTNM